MQLGGRGASPPRFPAAATRRGRPGRLWLTSWSDAQVTLAATVVLATVITAGLVWMQGSTAVLTAATSIGSRFTLGTWVGDTVTTGELMWIGSNGYGQGGVGDVEADWTAATESTAATTWTQVSVGIDHTCGVRTGGTLWCWGRNDSGQLGLGTTSTAVTSPTQVTSPSVAWAQVSAGALHTCGVTTGGVLYCWGLNGSGQLGVNDTTSRSTPTEVYATPAQGGWGTVAVGTSHTCATYTGNTLYCWGSDANGVVGNGANYAPSVPKPASVGTQTWATNTIVSGNETSCATTTANALYCWGLNTYGQFGDGTTTTAGSPRLLSGTWVQAAVGTDHICVRSGSGTVSCAGRNQHGQLGQGTTTNLTAFTQVGSATTWTDLVAGGDTTCGRQTNDVWCWGSNEFGSMGLGVADKRLSPTALTGTTAMVSVRGHRVCLLATTGTLSCAGGNGYGGLGRGTTTAELASTVRAVTSVLDWSLLAPGSRSTCGISAGSLYCWGSNSSGQLGQGDTAVQSFPVQVGTATDWASVTVGGLHACGIRGTALFCWGENEDGQLGDGSTTDRYAPVQIASGTSWSSVVAGGAHTCALTTAGALYCWGDNSHAQLGDTSTTDRSSPTLIGTAAWTKLALGAFFSCAVQTTTAGSLWCWGENEDGQLGVGSVVDKTSPTRIGTLTTWTDVVAGDAFGCARQTSSLLCWGDNSRGQVGDGTAVDKTAPTAVTGTWAAVDAGRAHACAVTAAQDVSCWGANDRGQLGLGTTTDSTSPQSVTTAETAAAGGEVTYLLVGDYAGAVLADSPVGYWRLGESSGTTEARAFSGSPTGTYRNTPTLGVTGAIAGDASTAVTLDGSSENVYFTDVHDFAGQAQFSVECWVRIPSYSAAGSWPRVVSKEHFDSASAHGGWSISLNPPDAGSTPNSVTFGRYSGTAPSEISGVTALQLDTWHHLVGTFDGTAITIYIDGAYNAQRVQAIDVEDHTSPFVIGAMTPYYGYLNGTVDEVAVYDHALSASRINAHYLAGKS